MFFSALCVGDENELKTVTYNKVFKFANSLHTDVHSVHGATLFISILSLSLSLSSLAAHLEPTFCCELALYKQNLMICPEETTGPY